MIGRPSLWRRQTFLLFGSNDQQCDCALLAPDGGEQEVQLPGTEEYDANRRHPLHVYVHLGVPGEEAQPGTIFVAIGDDGSLTAAAYEFCEGEFVNGP